MAFPELASYIAEQTQQGIGADTLRQSLMEAGWTEADIDNAFHDVAAGLDPLTDGASIHEDLSQVRSMVVHLAARLKNVEALLATAGALPMQAEIMAGTGLPERTLPAPHARFQLFANGAALAYAVLACWGMFAIAASASGPAPLFFAAGIGIVGLSTGMVMLRFRYVWSSAIMVATALTLAAVTTWYAWSRYQAMETTTAVALTVLLTVIGWVVGRRLDRAEK